MSKPSLILASQSPRRRQLLADAGYAFQFVSPSHDAECGLCSKEGPAGLVTDLAYRKAADVVRQLSETPDANGAIVIGADTVAECDGAILGKPRSESDARAMLRQLSGRRHRVFSGLCVWPLDHWQPLIRVAVTQLHMDPLTDQQISEYLAGGQWAGKAGAFGYQDRLGWVHIDEGSESNVVGLPMELLAELLNEVGYSADA